MRAPLAVYNALPVPVSLVLKCSLRASRTAVKCARRLSGTSAQAPHRLQAQLLAPYQVLPMHYIQTKRAVFLKTCITADGSIAAGWSWGRGVRRCFMRWT